MAFLLPLLGGLFGAAGSLISGNTQANAAEHAAQLQYNLGEQGLDFQKQQYQQGQQNMAPWIQAGQGAVSTLAGLQNQGLQGSGPLAPWTQQFQAPTAEQARQTPGYQFALGQGQNAVENSAAARGGLVSGNEATALDTYSQGLADTTYNDTYNRALQQYQMGYSQYQQNQSNIFNRYASLAGLGQTSAAQSGQLGQQAANNTGNLLTNIGGQVGQNINNAGAATASGYAGATNAATGGANNLQQYLMLQQLMAGGGAQPGNSPYAGQTYQGPGGS
jgi:hypothetical protein